MKRFLSLILAGIMLISLVACKKEDTETIETTEGAQETNPDASAVIFESDNYTVTVAEFQYFLAKVYDDFAAQYGDMINYILDTSKPLRDQSCPVDQSGEMTWFDYVADGAVTTVESYILLAEEAHDVGFELSDEDISLIEEEIAALDTRAVEAGYESVEEYIRTFYGSFATKESLRECFTLSYLANAYRAEKYNGYTYTDEDYLAYAEANPASCYYADFMYMRITADIAEDATDAEKAAEWDKTKQTAIDFNNAVSSKDTFLAQTEAYMRSVSTMVDSEDEVNYDTNHYTEEALKEAVNGVETIGVQYSTGAANVDWIFADGRIAGEQTVIEDEENYTCEIIYMLKPMYLAEKPTVDVRHILITPDTEGDDYKALAKATSIYEEWLEGEATEETFAELAVEHTEDTGSLTTGGLYQAVVPGQMVTEFNDWCFDESRKTGDTEIVATDYGYHIMYFVKNGLVQWKNAADTGLRDAAMTAYMEDLAKKYTVEHTAENIDKCPDLFGE